MDKECPRQPPGPDPTAARTDPRADGRARPRLPRVGFRGPDPRARPARSGRSSRARAQNGHA